MHITVKAYARDQREKRKAKGMCVRCGVRAVDKRATCEPCLKAVRTWQRQHPKAKADTTTLR